jgi:2-polyprenyl-3-methyl-5-hydroxy-6-metoxy-1,4-benzoquinol methylase
MSGRSGDDPPTAERGGAEARRARAWAYENPRPEVQAAVPHEARRILDIGCASGALGAALKQRQGAEVVGVEIDPAYAHDAASRLDRVVRADVEDLFADLDAPPDLGHFDCLIAADVLEHLRDPWRVLGCAAALLDGGGTAVISLPNARYWETFFQLGVKGTWPLRNEGIFDRTHLRWFTRADALALLDQAGLEPAHVSPQYRLKPSDWRTERQARRLARSPLRQFLVFQYVLAGVKRPDVP